MKITVAGTGYVGMANAVLLSQHNEVIAYDIVKKRVDLINKKQSPIDDNLIVEFLQTKKLNLTATLDKVKAYKDAQFVIVATPTDYNPNTNYFDTSSIESVVADVLAFSNMNPTIVIKSTVPVGYTESIKEKYGFDNIIFAPEFLREGNALHDCLYPSRIIVGDCGKPSRVFAKLLKQGAVKSSWAIYSHNTEAEAVKLFSNAYLAMRVAFFNELDTYADIKGLSSRTIISGVCQDNRIGFHYNNPSLGYGGYCFPKDTKQLLANYNDIPQKIISAIVESNKTRKNFVTSRILERNPKVVGIYRLVMKAGSDNFRSSAIQDVMIKLHKSGVTVIIYEPLVDDFDENYQVVNDIEMFKSMSDVIVANRMNKDLYGLHNKLYCRDVWGTD
jgi:UDPglucose 6-dehydrogenase